MNKHPRTVLVFAGNHNEFLSYVKKAHERSIFNTSGNIGNTTFIDVTSSSKAYGHNWKYTSLVKVGEWFKHDWTQDVIEDIEHRMAIAKGIS